MLRSEFRGVREGPGGFVGTSRDDIEFRVMLTPEQGQENVVDCEIGCRSDYGVDADSAGDGPMVATHDLDEAMATMDPDESFLVLARHRLAWSTRAELLRCPALPHSGRPRRSCAAEAVGGTRQTATASPPIRSTNRPVTRRASACRRRRTNVTQRRRPLIGMCASPESRGGRRNNPSGDRGL
jgi:hypothetical protein